ncbi:MAG TPA: fused MFS/spermidine synthase [Acidimicrobiales bacterium]|nr:fused MFS/spermidine synthase [Acidimicrobiales bacterium]
MRSWTAGLLVFCTSAAVLVLEIIAGRLVAPHLGVSLETYTGIIGTVLAGIALGSAVGGRLADRYDARRLLGPTLVLGGLLALTSLPVVTAVGPTVAGGGPGAIVLLTVLAFFAPAAVLSGVSPMAAKLRLESLVETGSVVGGLSAAGTAGALVGTFLTGFVLVGALPSRAIVVALGLGLLVAGFVLWLVMAPARRVVMAGAAVVAVLVAGVSTSAAGPCHHETAYFCARVELDPGRPSGRVLVLDDLRHSYVDLDDPTHLEFRYIRLFADVIDATTAGPIEVLHVGGGGFTMPRWLAATRPGSASTVLELDADLVDIVRDELGLVTGPDLRVVTGDARTALDDLPADRFDVVVGDAFGGVSVPWHLTTVEVVRLLDRVLRPDGVYVLNVIDGGPRRFLRAEVATLQAVFDHVAVIEPPGQDGSAPQNHVLVASHAPLTLAQGDLDVAEGLLADGADLDVLVGGARVLTDGFAPVDQLISRR